MMTPEEFLDIATAIDRASFNRFLKQNDLSPQTEAAKEAAKAAFIQNTVVLQDLGLRAFSIDVLRQARGPLVEGVKWTAWERVYRPATGIQFFEPWHEYVATHERHCRNAVSEKPHAGVHAPVITSDGYRRDESIDAMTLLNFDADSVGDWRILETLLNALEVAYVLHESGGHRPGRERWHVSVPLSRPWSDLQNWRGNYLAARVTFGAAAWLPGWGFDAACDVQSNAYFFGARRDYQDPPRRCVAREGHTIDLGVLLTALPSVPDLRAPEAGKPPRVSSPVKRPSPTVHIEDDPTRPAEAELPSLAERRRRARAYVAKMPSAVEGCGGSDACFQVAVALVRGFCLPPEMALEILLRAYNPRCVPPWSVQELAHKVGDAEKGSRRPWGYLLGAAEEPRTRDNGRPGLKGVGGIDPQHAAAPTPPTPLADYCPRPVDPHALLQRLPPRVRAAAEGGWRPGGSYTDPEQLAWTVALCALRARADKESIRDLLSQIPAGQPLRDDPDPGAYVDQLYASAVNAFLQEIPTATPVRLVKVIVVASRIHKSDAAQVIAYVHLDVANRSLVPYVRTVDVVLGEPHFGELGGDWLELLDVFPEVPELHDMDPRSVIAKTELVVHRPAALAVWRRGRISYFLPPAP